MLELIQGNIGMISAVLAFIIVKAVPTGAAIPIISQAQKVVDMLAKGCEIVGKILADLIKSDGILGKK